MINETVRRANERRRRCILMGGPPTINKQQRVTRANLLRGTRSSAFTAALPEAGRRVNSVAHQHDRGALLQGANAALIAVTANGLRPSLSSHYFSRMFSPNQLAQLSKTCSSHDPTVNPLSSRYLEGRVVIHVALQKRD